LRETNICFVEGLAIPALKDARALLEALRGIRRDFLFASSL